MNILFVSPGYKPSFSGSDRIVEQLSRRYLGFDGVEKVGILTTYFNFNFYPPREDRSLPEEEVIDGVKVYRMAFRPIRLRVFHHLGAGLFSWKARRAIADFQPDVVHFLVCEWALANLWIYLLTRRQRHIFTVAFHEPPLGFRSLVINCGNRLLCRLVDVVQVHSVFVKKRVMDFYHAPEEKIVVVPPGPGDISSREPPARRQADDCVSLIAVGRLAADKGQLDLIRAFHRSLPGLRRQARLVLVGGDGGHRNEIEKYVSDHGLGDRVELTGFLGPEELNAAYERSDIFALLSRVESFGIVFAEAQARGLPVIGYRIGPLEAAFKKGGILVEPHNQDQVVEAIQRLVNDEDLLAAMSREAFDYAWQNFSWETMADRLMAVTRDLARPA